MQRPGSESHLPAVLFSEEQTSGLQIAALSILDRLVVAVNRAGAGPIVIVSRGRIPALKRTTALGIPFCVLADPPNITQPTLIASASLLVQAPDVRKLLTTHGRLVAQDGTRLPIGVADNLKVSLDESLADLKPVHADGIAFRVECPASARTAENGLWQSLTSSSDGLVDKLFNRPCGRPLSKLLIHTPITPNAVSIASILIGLLAAVLFAKGDHASIIAAALIFQLSTIVDCVDGDIARVVFKESALGKWLDIAGDQLVHVAVFAGIALGLTHSHQTAGAHWLGLSAVLGALLSFAVVLRGMHYPPESRSRLLQKLIDSTTNRDFSVLVLILACFQSLEWFLWMAAIGSHLFWITALSLQARPTNRQN